MSWREKALKCSWNRGPVTVWAFEIVSIQVPIVHFKIVCSTGTYIRSLANDFGAALGCGGYLSSLCRTRIGTFSNTHALTLEEWEKKINEDLKRIGNA